MNNSVVTAMLVATVLLVGPIVASSVVQMPERSQADATTPIPVTTPPKATDTGDVSANDEQRSDPATETIRHAGRTVPNPPEERAQSVDEAPDIDEVRLERRLVAGINGYRDDPLRHDTQDETVRPNTTTGRELTTLARTHSDRMADRGSAAKTVAGNDTRGRYEDAGLFKRCRLGNRKNAFIRPMADLELVTSVDPGDANETRIADAVVDYWYDRRESRDTLAMPNAEHVGVGVSTADDVVYISVNIC